ncbi:MAG TPA: GNAT family N-acetyltransferase [Propionibacteriaceae bacterium]|nr:GNAT family N-acetyltransferase [Propionibacteriaceae bacterium]
MHIRDFLPADLPALIDLTIEAFRPLFEADLPAVLDPRVFAHDHGRWEDGYRREVPTLHDPASNRFITLAEDDGRLLGYVGWQVNPDGSGRLQMVAVHPDERRRGVGLAVCRAALMHLKENGVTVVHVGTGGDAFHAPARRLYESLGFTGYPVVDYTRAI